MTNTVKSLNGYGVLPSGDYEKLKRRCFESVEKKYGEILPDIVRNRMELELQVIAKNGYAGEFLMAARLTDQSRYNGPLVKTTSKKIS